MVGLGAQRIQIWDMDTIAESNLNRQLYGVSRIGQNKAEALVDMLKTIAPGGGEQNIEAIPNELEVYTLDITEIEEFEVFINATDNLYHHGQMLKKLRLLMAGEPFIYLSPRMAGFEAEVFVVDGSTENDYAYFHTKEEWEKINATRQSCTDGGAQFNPSIITTSVVLAALTIQQLINILNEEDSFQWVRIEIDTMKVAEREPFTVKPKIVPKVPKSTSPFGDVDFARVLAERQMRNAYVTIDTTTDGVPPWLADQISGPPYHDTFRLTSVAIDEINHVANPDSEPEAVEDEEGDD